MPNNTAYCLSKGGVRMLTRTAGVELAPHGITMVNIGVGPANAKTITDHLAVLRRCCRGGCELRGLSGCLCGAALARPLTAVCILAPQASAAPPAVGAADC